MNRIAVSLKFRDDYFVRQKENIKFYDMSRGT